MATEEYEWPSPHAHFAVWHCELRAEDDLGGVWLAGADARRLLGQRHWWPLTSLLPDGTLR